MAKIYCPSCEALVINGLACHETGCPKADRKWVSRGRGLKGRIYIPEGEEPPLWAQKMTDQEFHAELRRRYGVHP